MLLLWVFRYVDLGCWLFFGCATGLVDLCTTVVLGLIGEWLFGIAMVWFRCGGCLCDLLLLSGCFAGFWDALVCGFGFVVF